MEAFTSALTAMAMLAIAIAVGFLLRKLKWVNDQFDAILSRLTIQVACTALIISSILSCTSLPSIQTTLQILGISTIVWVPVLLVGFVLPFLYRVPKESRGVHQFTVAFNNNGLVGFAVLNTMLGSNAVLYASIFNIPYNIVMFSVGMMFMISSGDKEVSNKERAKLIGRNLISPVMIASVLALVLLLFNITDNDGIIGQTAQLIGQMTSPAAMLVIGSSIAKYRIRDMVNDWRAYITTFARLLLIPLIVFFFVGLFTSDSFTITVLTLDVAMPVASMGSMFCILFGGDLMTMSRCTFLTTILSLITIPVVSMFVM